MEDLQKEIKNRFRVAMTFLNLEIKDICDTLGFGESKVKNLRTGHQQITPEIALQLEDKYFINASWLIFGKGEMILPSFDIGEKKQKISNEEILKKLEERESFIEELRKETLLLKESLKS